MGIGEKQNEVPSYVALFSWHICSIVVELGLHKLRLTIFTFSLGASLVSVLWSIQNTKSIFITSFQNGLVKHWWVTAWKSPAARRVTIEAKNHWRRRVVMVKLKQVQICTAVPATPVQCNLQSNGAKASILIGREAMQENMQTVT